MKGIEKINAWKNKVIQALDNFKENLEQTTQDEIKNLTREEELKIEQLLRE